MDETLRAWRAAGKHLPDILRDFHDQKDVFRTMHAFLGPQDPKDTPHIRRPDWIEGQCYVIDCFLWFMARHGYTLQRSRANQAFESLDDNIRTVRKSEAQMFARMLENTKNGAASAPSGQN